jgi:hypothetical protein
LKISFTQDVDNSEFSENPCKQDGHEKRSDFDRGLEAAAATIILIIIIVQ